MTHRAQLAILLLVLVLLALAILLPRSAASDAPVVASAVPQSEFRSIDGNSASDVVLAPANEARTPSPSAPRLVSVAPVSRHPVGRQSASSGATPATGSMAPSKAGRPVLAATSAPLRGKFGVAVGTASWWASFGPGIYAALPGYVAGTHVTIRVCSGSRCTTAPVITSCQCLVGTPDERIVDLSPGILRALGLDPARGLFQVSVEVTP